MSSNLIYNGDFSQPQINTNVSIYCANFTQTQANQFYWSYTGLYTALLNGPTYYGFPDFTSLGYIQLISLYAIGSSIQQSFTVTQLGAYTLSFYYCARSGYPFENFQIYINGVLFDTITNSPSVWTLYTNTINNLILGVNSILFLGQIAGGDVGIVGIKLYYGQSGVSPPLITVQNNSFKSTNFYGAISVYDYIPSGGALQQGLITTQRNYNYNYAVFPTYTPNSLGYQYKYTFTSGGSLSGFVGVNTTITSTPIILPLGYYLVSCYCLYTLTSTTNFYTSLGLTSLSSVFMGYNYTKQYCPPLTNLQQSIYYEYYLQDISGSTYYFIFNTGSNTSGGQINSFNGSFLRIA